MIRASIIIPVHNRAALTQQCLDVIAAHPPGVESEIIVVDDASTDATPQLLAARDTRQARQNPGRVTVITHAANTGFAQSCNDGAAAATGDYLVFLNNDTIPSNGWLDALVSHADEHPGAAAVGSKLLYPDGTVQHAGVVIGQDRNPHHIYAGFPGDHPAVNRPRRFQVVTAACMLVRRDTFAAAGGFDAGYRNGHEDVDLCLRLGAAGHQIWYCPASVLCHLESATRGRRTAEAAANGRRYRQRWAASVRPDDIDAYLEDGLLSVAYSDAYPLRLGVSPSLATLRRGGRKDAREQLLRVRSQQVADLLERLIGLTVEQTGQPWPAQAVPASPEPEDDDELAEALAHVQSLLAARRGAAAPATTSAALAYRSLVRRVQASLATLTPPGSTVAVVSRGDDDLVEIKGRTGWHFPRDEEGRWAGHHPADSDAAVAAVEAERQHGATHLAVPAPSRWWLDQYRGFADHLRTVHRQVADTAELTVFDLGACRAAGAGRRRAG